MSNNKIVMWVLNALNFNDGFVESIATLVMHTFQLANHWKKI